jgi:hypothetical protein
MVSQLFCFRPWFRLTSIPTARPRLLGYAGIPLLQLVPCVFLGLRAARRLRQIHKIHQRLSVQIADHSYYYGSFMDPSTRTSTPSHPSVHPTRGQSAVLHSSYGLPSLAQLKSPRTLTPVSPAIDSLTGSAALRRPPSSPKGCAGPNDSLEYPVFVHPGILASLTITTPSSLPDVSDVEEGMCVSQGAGFVEYSENGDILESKIQRLSSLRYNPNSAEADASTAGGTIESTLNDQDYGFGPSPMGNYSVDKYAG